MFNERIITDISDLIFVSDDPMNSDVFFARRIASCAAGICRCTIPLWICKVADPIRRRQREAR